MKILIGLIRSVLFLWVFIFGCPAIIMATPSFVTSSADSLTLVSIYNSTDGENWLNTWDLEQPMNTWYGVITNAAGCVAELTLTENGLNGVFPSEVGDLDSLEILALQDNELTGTLPIALTQLTKLRSIYLGGNQLTGALPPEYGTIISLEYFGLTGNQITGNIPAEWGDLINLKGLWLGNNQLTGTIPAALFNCLELRSLLLYNNDFFGEIPTEIGNCTEIFRLGLQENNFWGAIPTSIGNLTLLETFYANNNLFSGEIPEEIGNCTELVKLGLQNNFLTGTIPPSLANTQITRLQLNNNQLTGEIPSELGNLLTLDTLVLSNNQLTGLIPESLSNLENIVGIHLNDNQLEGCFPSSFIIFCGLGPSTVDGGNGYNFSNNPNLPSNGDFTDFCVTGQGMCNLWPGDANNDGTVNCYDVFSLGYKNGWLGVPRFNQSTEWMSIPAVNWGEASPDGVDANYADCDGNGIIDIQTDIQVIETHYGQVHDEAIHELLIQPSGIEVELTPIITTDIAGDARLGFSLNYNDEANELANVFGIAFQSNVSLDTFDLSNSSWTTNAEDLYFFEHPYSNSSMDVAFVQTNEIGVLGLTTIADFIIVEDNIPSADELTLSLANVVLTDEGGNLYAATTADKDVFLTDNFGSTDELLASYINATESDCNGGKAEVIPLGVAPPYTYHWQDGLSNPLATQLALGTHQVTITDASGNTVAGYVEIEGVAIIEAAFEVTIDATTETGSVEITSLSGGSGNLDIVWDNGQTGSMATGLSLGTHTVTFTDETGCVHSKEVEIIPSTSVATNVSNEPITWTIYPNPAHHNIHISIENVVKKEAAQLVLRNSLGQELSKQLIDDSSTNSTINIQKNIAYLPTGWYILQVEQAGEIRLSKRIFKE